MKIKKKHIFLSALAALSFLALGAGFGITQKTEIASASSVTYTPKCLTRGTTTTGSSTTTGCPENFKVYMYGANTSGTRTIYKNELLDWSKYNISVETSKVSDHISFKLYRNGTIYTSKSLSGNGNAVLFSGSLSDAKYELEYTCRYRSNIFVGYTTYTYKYSFETDKSDPTYELRAGGVLKSSGSYTNQQIVYTASDAHLSYIRYQSPQNSNYNYYYGGSSYTVAATSSNNGWWYFCAYDTTGSSCSEVSIYLDTVAPVGKLTDSNGSTISNGGYTNKSFKYTATDTGGVARYEIKRPDSSAWYSYTAGTSISGSNGWYYFRAYDKAGNLSDEYRVFYDNGAPSGILYGGTTVKANGSFTNASYVKYVASDNYSGIANCYVKMPGSSSYTTYASGTQLATEGAYHFYCVDRSGNVSPTVSIVLDKTSPTGTLYGGTTSKATGSYTNASYVKYVANDSVSGVVSCYVLKPGKSSYENYTSGTQLTAEGIYYFYAVDRSGNSSPIVSITMDRTLPLGTLYGGTESKSSGSYTNAAYVKYTAGDTISGVSACYVKMPNSSYFTNYSAGTQLATEGKYFFYAVDKSGNASETVSITLDKTKPVGTLYAGNTQIGNGGITNAEFVKFVPYDSTGIAVAYVKKPGTNNFVNYSSGVELTGEGKYEFYCKDLANNESEHYTVTLDRHIPAAGLYVDDEPFANNGYTNGAHIKFECAEKCYVKLPGSEAFTDYVSGVEYYKSGKYVFYGISEAGSSSGYYSIVIDRTVKTLEVVGATDGKTDGDVTLAWTDGDANEFAPMKTVKINGKVYTKGETVYTIDTGVYHVECEDAAGNTWETEFSSSKVNMVTKTLQKQYFEAYNAAEEYFAFASYDSAFAFAAERERAYVRTGEWKNDTWDTGLAMDEKDSVNAKQGTYFIYKKSGNADAEVAYFTEERLSEVIAEYAKIGIESYYYWEKSPETIAEGEYLYAFSDAKTILANSVTFGEHIACLVDGEQYFSSVYENEGEHVLTVCDEWGNTCDYTLIVIRNVPNICYAINGGDENVVIFDRLYRFKDEVKISIADSYDEMAMFTVYDENGNILGKFGREEVFMITKSGSYTVEAVNHFGKSEIFTLTVSRDAPKVEINEQKEEKKLNISYAESADKESHVATFEIYKSIDGGENWVLLTRDDYGAEIALGTFFYNFRTTSIYKAVLTDEFRTGIDAVTKVFDYVQANPEGTLHGVEDGGYTNGTVSFEWVDEANVTLEKDGEVLEYQSNQTLKEDGMYRLTFENFDGYTKSYTFVIDTVAPEVVLSSVGADGKLHALKRLAGICSNENLIATFTDGGATAEIFRNGVSAGNYRSGAVIKTDGTYSIIVKDLALNETRVNFAIDKFVDFEIDINDRGLSNVVTVKANEELIAVLTKDGESVAYTFGDAITAPGYYTLTLADSVENQIELSFTIVEPLVKSYEYNFDDMPGFEKVLVNGEEKRLNYGTLELKEDGMYEIGVVVNGKTYSYAVTVDATAPTLVLSGVENGGSTKGKVTLSELSENAELKLFFENEEIEYNLGEELSEVGHYRAVLTDDCGNSTEYNFEIKKGGLNAGVIVAIVLGGVLIIGGVTVFILKKKNVF